MSTDDRPLGAFPQPFRLIVWPRGVRPAESEIAREKRIARLRSVIGAIHRLAGPGRTP